VVYRRATPFAPLRGVPPRSFNLFRPTPRTPPLYFHFSTAPVSALVAIEAYLAR